MILQDRNQRIAFARIISDLIEADFIIEADEIKKLGEIKDKFNISQDMLIESRKRTFEWAVSILCQLKNSEKQEVKDALCGLALSDGSCVPLEALQIMSLLSALDGKGEVFSIPSANNYVDNMKVIYVENEDGTEESEYVSGHYRAICNEFHMAGFDFVYIPQIAKDYKYMDQKYLNEAISYMIPSLDEGRKNSIQADLCTMTTSRFCRYILYGKMGLKVLGTKPALLFKTGESYVVNGADDDARIPYSNYLKIDLEGNALQQIVALMDTYRGMVNTTSNIEVHPYTKKFLYYGFHRSLFDLIAFCKNKVEYYLVFDINKKEGDKLYFRSKDDANNIIPLKLTSLAMALYMLIIRQSLFGDGLDWRENITSADKAALIDKFNKIYYPIGNGKTAVKFKDRTLVSRMKKAIESQKSSILNINSFIPELKQGDNLALYSVPVPPGEMYVVEDGEEVLMTKSAFWKEL